MGHYLWAVVVGMIQVCVQHGMQTGGKGTLAEFGSKRYPACTCSCVLLIECGS